MYQTDRQLNSQQHSNLPGDRSTTVHSSESTMLTSFFKMSYNTTDIHYRLKSLFKRQKKKTHTNKPEKKWTLNRGISVAHKSVSYVAAISPPHCSSSFLLHTPENFFQASLFTLPPYTSRRQVYIYSLQNCWTNRTKQSKKSFTKSVFAQIKMILNRKQKKKKRKKEKKVKKNY